MQKEIAGDSMEWAAERGQDEYGEYAAFEYKGVKQYMRWIKPGEFLMGIALDEKGKTGEKQHPVQITNGFWLADTTCTQALWQAVMGTNPAQFKGAQLPVETVSWQSSQEFIIKINELIPGLDARLPTEAEWEYTCRAGTSLFFSFGRNIITAQVNYNGLKPYNYGEIGTYRNQTVEVKSLPCNSWGLYQMHGNVWEWCADLYDPSVDYYKECLAQSVVKNPPGPDSGKHHIIRGGSWQCDGPSVRSAHRQWKIPSYESLDLGLRLARGPYGEPGSLTLEEAINLAVSAAGKEQFTELQKQIRKREQRKLKLREEGGGAAAEQKRPWVQVKRYERIRPEMHKYWDVIRVAGTVCTYNAEISTRARGGAEDIGSIEEAVVDVEELCALTEKNGYFEVKGMPGLGKLKPMAPVKQKLPHEFLEAFKAAGISNEGDMLLPIECTETLGRSPVSSYHSCPNIPEHHLELCASSPNHMDELGDHYWFDLELTGKDGNIFPLRLVYCLGDADTNDGIWGAYWNRESEEVVANIKSTGDGVSGLEVVSESLKTTYVPHDYLIPEILGGGSFAMGVPISTQNQLELERVLVAGIRLSANYE